MRIAERGLRNKKHGDGMWNADRGLRNEKGLIGRRVKLSAGSKILIMMLNHATNRDPQLNSLLVPQSAFRNPHFIHVAVSV
jgi:hypothetical protein